MIVNTYLAANIRTTDHLVSILVHTKSTRNAWLAYALGQINIPSLLDVTGITSDIIRGAKKTIVITLFDFSSCSINSVPRLNLAQLEAIRLE